MSYIMAVTVLMLYVIADSTVEEPTVIHTDDVTSLGNEMSAGNQIGSESTIDFAFHPKLQICSSIRAGS